MGDLIVAGFTSPHSALLARAALARVRKELSLRWDDLAVLIREEGDEPILLEVARLRSEEDLRDEGEMPGSFWDTLIGRVLASDSPVEADANAATAKLAELGIDEVAKAELAVLLRTRASSLLVFVAGRVIRDQVLGVLRGFQGEIALTQLKDEHRTGWRCTLSSRQPEKERMER